MSCSGEFNNHSSVAHYVQRNAGTPMNMQRYYSNEADKSTTIQNSHAGPIGAGGDATTLYNRKSCAPNASTEKSSFYRKLPPTGGNSSNRQLSKNEQITPNYNSVRLNTVQLQRGTISTLSPGMVLNSLVCLVIAKDEPRSVLTKKSCGSERFVYGFTVRDSPSDFINVSSWGSERFIKDQASLFTIGDIIEIQNILIQSKSPDGASEKFHPWTPSACTLSMGESRSTVEVVSSPDLQRSLGSLRSIPVKNSGDFIRLAQLMSSGQAVVNESVNLLAGIRQVTPIKKMTSKTGRKLCRCEIKLFDETCSCFSLVIWSAELAQWAQNWDSKEHILFAADVRIGYDDYRQILNATVTSRSILTLNPDTEEAQHLYTYVTSADLPADQLFSTDTGAFNPAAIDLSEIQTVYTVEQYNLMINHPDTLTTSSAKCGIVFAYVTTFDLDGDLDKIIFKKCGSCKRRLEADFCINLECPLSDLGEGGELSEPPILQYNISVALTDHTGTIAGCKLAGPVAQKLLNIMPDDFQSKREESRTEIKWQYLMECFKVYLNTHRSLSDHERQWTSILSCERASMEEYSRFL